jgi:glyoxylase-like metal-dependent hydrolase (beta-lactamase superfamily II)
VPIRLIDLMHLGRPRVIACYQLDDVLIDPGPESCLPTLLEAVGERAPRVLLLTHIHLDHAGASGALVQRWPDLEVYVHERGAAHLIDPSRLMQSARRLYGEDMDRLWGAMTPVPEANLRVLGGGERVLGDAFEVAYTPGHASHHVSYLHDGDGTAFVGDVGGVRIPPSSMTIPPTPPPDIDIEAWHRSIELVCGWAPQRLAMTHFGLGEDVDGQLAQVGHRLDQWARQVPGQDMEMFIDWLGHEVDREAGSELVATYAQAAPPDQLYKGMDRYLRKRAEAVNGPTETGSRVS